MIAQAIQPLSLHSCNVMMEVSGLRRFGAAALDCAYVASGRTDGYWEDSSQI
ncbi:hypothetical protein GCM10023262_00340 [Bartonella pachyuromydis]|uniref:Uncharacterized protein n=1 Tax=Bartonella pachyuromydis TaxID=931097 RepID=A0ABP8VAS9_9HYPH